jgi:hypothetical protein
MPLFNVHLINNHFASKHSMESSSLEAARAEALRSALQIGADEICKGETFFGAEIRIQGDDKIIDRMMVAIGTTSLQ